MRYKAKVSKVIPHSERFTYQAGRQCYLGVSINDNYIQPAKLQATIEWISENYESCLIVIGDYLNRLNEYILFGHNEVESIEKSLYLGQLSRQAIEAEISKYEVGKFKIIHWKEIIDSNSEFESIHISYTSASETSAKFRESLVKSASTYVNKQLLRGNLFTNKEEAIQRSIEYILEELSVFSYLIDNGYHVQVYPGTILGVIKELANNKISDINTNIRSGTFIELNLKSKN